MDMKKILKKLLGIRKTTSEELLNTLRKKGAVIGDDVLIYSTSTTMIDQSTPYLLTIGSHVRIAAGVRILTHDYAWSVLKHYAPEGVQPGAVLGAQSAVEIGSCVFIGMNALITRGVKIGDHVVIGAGSVVTKDCPSNGVYAGNPARRIMSIEEYYHKRKELQFAEARSIAIRYFERFGQKPPVEVFSEYFMLFCSREEAMANEVFRAKLKVLGNLEESAAYMDQNPPMFAGYDAFLEACYKDA